MTAGTKGKQPQAEEFSKQGVSKIGVVVHKSSRQSYHASPKQDLLKAPNKQQQSLGTAGPAGLATSFYTHTAHPSTSRAQTLQPVPGNFSAYFLPYLLCDFCKRTTQLQGRSSSQKSKQLPTSEQRHPIKSTVDSCEPLVYSIMMQTTVTLGRLLPPRAQGILGLS